MKKTSTAKKPFRKPKPALKWQTGAYDRYPEYRFILPYPFLLLCRLTDITPQKVLTDFMDNLSCGSWQPRERDKAKEHLINYFIAHGYGRHHYTEEDLRQVFKEIDALGALFPVNGKRKIVDLYTKWRSKHHTYWFKKWFKKPKRKVRKEGEP